MILLLAACGPSTLSVGLDTGGSTPADTDTDTDTDTESDTDTDTDTETTETIPDPPDTGSSPDAEFDPPGGTFVDSITVTLSLNAGEDAWYTTDGSLPTDRDDPYTKPIELADGAEVRALVRNAAGLEDYGSASFVEIDSSIDDFSSNLPLLVIYSDDGLPSSGDESYTSIHFQVHEPAKDGRTPLVGNAALTSRAALQVRGSSTAYDDKSSYALELRETENDDDRNLALLGMPAESDWVLYAPTGFDRALMRNALMFLLSNEIGRYAPRTRFVEVFAVGRGSRVREDDYIGVYTLMERIKVGPDRVNITALTAKDTTPPEVTGGYLFKRDRVGENESGFEPGTVGGTFYFDDPLIYVDPEEDVIERQQATYLYDAVDTFAEALASGADYSGDIDIDSWVDNHILNLYPKNPDALRLSQYMYKDRESPMMAGPIWDFDRTMGCDDDDRPIDPTWWDPSNQTSDTTYMFTYGWYDALFDDPTFTAAYWARWSELIDTTFATDHVDAMIDEMAAELEEAAERNFDRWPDYAPTSGTFQSEVDHLKDWLDQRHAWVDTCINTHADPETCTGD